MAKDFSFDIECQYDAQEIKNAIDQAKREIQTRFDFKNIVAEITLSEDNITILTESDMTLESIKQIIISKMVKRNQSPKVLDFSAKPEQASGMKLRHIVKLTKALETEDIKKINKIIKENFPKVKTSIQGATSRVQSSSKNDLQKVMKLIKSNKEISLPVTFTNFR